MLYGAMKFCK